MQVIADTLEFNLPYEKNRDKAQAVPSTAERDKFCTFVANELAPWGQRFGVEIGVRQMPESERWPWGCIEIGSDGSDTSDKIDVDDWKGLLRAADEAAATEIVIRYGTKRLVVGRLAQRRYWSETQARLLAQQIIWSYVDLVRDHPSV